MSDMEKLLKILKEACPGVDFESSDALVDDGVLDSFDIVSIVSAIMDEYDVLISVNELVPENFNSVSAMYELIEKLGA